MTETATFGAGCFWGIEAAFRRIPGVVDAVVGYSGGHTENPTYKDVCTDETGHAEVVQVTFDPAKVSHEKLLDAFWQLHDPTQVNRQGGLWHAIPHGDFLSLTRAGSDREEVARRTGSQRQIQAFHRHGNYRRRHL